MASVTDWLRRLASGALNATSSVVKAASAPRPVGGHDYDPTIITNPNHEGYINGYSPAPTSTSSYGGSSGGSYSGGGGYSAPAPVDPDAAAKDAAKADIRNKFGTLQQVFNSLFGELDTYGRDQSAKLDQNYGSQQDDLIKSFSKYNDSTNQQFAARGAYDSSYRGGALDEGNQIFNKELTNLGLDRENKLAEIGKYIATQKAPLTSRQQQLGQYVNNLDQYGLSDLLNLQGTVDSSIAQGQQTAAGLGTNQEFIGGLQAIAPIQQQGTAQLAAKLQNLITSSAPTQAKKYIAQGLIKASTLNDANAQGYWNSYFEDLLRGSGVA